ncbi:MAG TPA: hypothetical protein DD435_14675 [Cyanobacteria bacterium UBA8530]|nr:hypothetical protein [Cyanobacteria bacterium UBA8530]
MIRPYREDDFWDLASLIERALEEYPAWSFLPGAPTNHPRGFRIWEAGDEIAGFLFLLGEEYKVLGGLYLEPGRRQELDSMLNEAFQPLFGDPENLALTACAEMGGFSLVPALSSLGFDLVERLELVQEREKTFFRKPSLPSDYRLIPWEPRFFDAAVALLEKSNRGTLEGLFLCFPSLATLENCRKLLQGILEGDFGPFLSDATGLLFDDADHLVGLSLMVQSNEGEALLYEIALERGYQGKGLAPCLIAHLQEASWKRGLDRIRFDYCGGNRAVRWLFGQDEVQVGRKEEILVWRSPRYRAMRKNPPI